MSLFLNLRKYYGVPFLVKSLFEGEKKCLGVSLFALPNVAASDCPPPRKGFRFPGLPSGAELPAS